jgi:hypothetical protein
MHKVRISAGNGSPRNDFASGARIGMRSSLATACISRGAPRNDQDVFDRTRI